MIKKQEGELQWFCQPVNDEFSYGVILGIRRVRNVTRLVWKIASSDDGRDWIEQGKKDVLYGRLQEMNFLTLINSGGKIIGKRAVCAFLINLWKNSGI